MGARSRLVALLAAVCCASAVALAPAAAQPSARHLSIAVSPGEGDIALVKLSFPRAHGRALTTRSLRLAGPNAFGDDLIALATPARPRGSARVALLLVANRYTKLADPTSVHVRAAAGTGLGPVRLRNLTDPFARHPAAPGWLCALASKGRAPALRALGARGRPISGLGAAGAVAEAFEIACGLPAGGRLRAALAPPGPVPAPAPPSEPPKCPPCDPRPGYACPLGMSAPASASICVAGREQGTQ